MIISIVLLSIYVMSVLACLIIDHKMPESEKTSGFGTLLLFIPVFNTLIVLPGVWMLGYHAGVAMERDYNNLVRTFMYDPEWREVVSDEQNTGEELTKSGDCSGNCPCESKECK